MRARFFHRYRGLFVALAVLGCSATGAPPALAAERVADIATAGPVRNILVIHVVPRSTAALLAVEQSFTSTLKSLTSDRLAFHSEYVDLATFEQKESFERELVAYLEAKYTPTSWTWW